MSNSNYVELFGATTIDRKEANYRYTWTVTNLNFLSEAKIPHIDSPKFLIKDKLWHIRLTSYRQNPTIIQIIR